MPARPDQPAPRPWGFATEQVHAGAEPDDVHGARIPPVHLTAGFVFRDFEDARARFAGDDDGYVYSRLANPTLTAVERRVARLEGGRDALLVGSGQAAVTVALLGLLGAGDHLLSAASVYEGSRGLFRENFARMGVAVDFVPTAADGGTDLDAWRRLLRPTTRAVFLESIPNPKNDVPDLRAVADLAHAHGIPVVVDNTLATPYLLRPLEHGADVVVHSASKFLAGHGAALGGAVVVGEGFDWAAGGRYPHLVDRSSGRSWVDRYGPRAYAEHVRQVVAARLGPTLSPVNAFLLQQGLETLSLRVSRHVATALTLARWLEQQPEVVAVDHAGLASSPSHALAQRYLPRGAGSVFGVTVAGGEAGARAFVDAVRLFTRMSHLGDVRSLVLHPASTSHAHRSPAERAAAGIWPGLLRLSIGLEEPEDLLVDLRLALDAVRDAVAGSEVAPTPGPVGAAVPALVAAGVL
ncbi:O-acetylhomoserine aminocarboxypropyltransferase/cysteine synthase family protein [Kineococcus terrestris]|uniref:O-acetylhomoserine aminocarboxypropyltransferase/cysteine synthase family protein n=1 Tax=Kineococcus terrestris TaxID=2044856 RepID=UPI0034DB254A